VDRLTVAYGVDTTPGLWAVNCRFRREFRRGSPGQERGRGESEVGGPARLFQPVEHADAGPAGGLDHGLHPRDEKADSVGPCAEEVLAPEDRRPQSALRVVVGRLDAVDVDVGADEGPYREPLAVEVAAQRAPSGPTPDATQITARP